MLNADKAILRKHFKGIVPRDVEFASSTFQTVIDSYEAKFQTRAMDKTKSRTTNTSFELLKNNRHYNVAIPPSTDPSPSVAIPICQFLQQTLAPQRASQSPMYYPSIFHTFGTEVQLLLKHQFRYHRQVHRHFHPFFHRRNQTPSYSVYFKYSPFCLFASI